MRLRKREVNVNLNLNVYGNAKQLTFQFQVSRLLLEYSVENINYS